MWETFHGRKIENFWTKGILLTSLKKTFKGTSYIIFTVLGAHLLEQYQNYITNCIIYLSLPSYNLVRVL